MAQAKPECNTSEPAKSAESASDGWVEEHRIVGRNATKADVLLGRIDGRPVAIKDYGPRPLAIRSVLGRWLAGREARAYRVASSVSGIPAFLGRRGPYALMFERIDGTPLAERPVGSVDATTFDRLDRVLAELHELGVALGDVHHRDVLLTRDGDLRIVDLATAWVCGRTPWSAWVFRRLRDQDRVAAARLRARFLERDEQQAVAAIGPSAAAWHRRGRSWKRRLDRLRGRHPDP